MVAATLATNAGVPVLPVRRRTPPPLVVPLSVAVPLTVNGEPIAIDRLALLFTVRLAHAAFITPAVVG
jgi:hypothetical protein